MSDVTLYHNPRCTKSRQALELLHARKIAPTIVEYLDSPPPIDELDRIVKLLDVL